MRKFFGKFVSVTLAAVVIAMFATKLVMISGAAG